MSDSLKYWSEKDEKPTQQTDASKLNLSDEEINAIHMARSIMDDDHVARLCKKHREVLLALLKRAA